MTCSAPTPTGGQSGQLAMLHAALLTPLPQILQLSELRL
jgi:hypothetical protein